MNEDWEKHTVWCDKRDLFITSQLDHHEETAGIWLPITSRYAIPNRSNNRVGTKGSIVGDRPMDEVNAMISTAFKVCNLYELGDALLEKIKKQRGF